MNRFAGVAKLSIAISLALLILGCGDGGFQSLRAPSLLGLDPGNDATSETTSSESQSAPSPLPPDSMLVGGGTASVVEGSGGSLGLLTKVSCAEARLELPVATHWSNRDGISEGASDQIAVKHPAGPKDHRFYNFHFLPEFEQYIGTHFSVSKWPDSEVMAWASGLCLTSGVAVEIRRPVSYSNWGISKKSVSDSRESIQVVPALRTQKSMITLFLPPGWNPAAPKGTYPLLVEGAYDVNDNVRTRGTQIARTLAEAWRAGHQAIGLTWNGGGSMASRSMNESAYGEFNLVVQLLGQHFGADPYRIVTFGISRGGSTALRIAANPKRFPYRVLAALASVPPAAPGRIVGLTGATIPALLHAAEWTIGIDNTWSVNWKYPRFEFGSNSLVGLTRNQAHLKILTGTHIPEIADQGLSSLSSETMLNSLKREGTQVLLDISSHDYIVPFVDQLRFSQLLEKTGIPHELQVNYLAGHWGIDLQARLNSAIRAAATRTSMASAVAVGKKSYSRVDPASGALKRISGPVFTLEIPRYISPSVGGHVIATGVPGTEVLIEGVAGETPFVERGVLDSNGAWIWDISAISPNHYSVRSVRILKPGQSQWKSLSMSRGTSRRDQTHLSLDVLSTDPTGTAESLLSSIQYGYLGSNWEYANHPNFIFVSYGISE